ncbi:hypothetical protein NFI96_003034 [Prochilodus magdalenae]|nr:hypothetical protein NFI96_003034 [Prochilodus magdalenae]
MLQGCCFFTAQADPFDPAFLYRRQSGPNAETILVANNGIRVPFGRSVYLDPINDLVTEVQPGDQEVKYTHFGSRSPSKDHVKLQLRYDSHTDTVVIPFMLEVEVVFQQLEILTRNMPLVVEKLNGQSNPIDKKGLEFAFEDGVTACKMIDCDEFLKKGIRYVHTATTKSPNRDYIPMLVEVQDNEGNTIQQEHFQIMVRIKEAEDVESNSEDLIFNITSPLGYQQGYIISTDDQNLPITSFHQRDIKDLKIAYKPPSEDSDIERIFQIEFEIVDTDGANLEISDEDNLEDVKITVVDGLKHADLDAVEFLFPITIAPTDDEPPIINANTGIVLFKNEMMQISPFILSATDIDSEDSTIKFILEEPYSAIDEMFEQVVTYWFQQDILDGKLFYRHKGPHSTTTVIDQFVFRVQDDNDPPNQSGEHTFTIKIHPVDDIPPTLYVGTSLHMTVQEYELTYFKKKFLRYTDLDCDDRDLKYTIIKPPTDTDENNPVPLGVIVLTDNPDTVISEFTQAQVNHHKVAYKPPDQELGITPKVVQFTFTVEDTAEDENIIFKVTQIPSGEESLSDAIKIDVSDGASIDVLENGATEITSNVIQGRDEDTDDLMLTFIVEEPPRLGEILVNGAPAERFTQHDIINGVVVYAHTSGEIGPIKEHDSFNLTISDMSDEWVVGGNKVQGVRVHVTILPVDSNAPLHIKAEDIDTDNDDILCTIIVQSTSGYVENISPAPGSEKSRAGTAITAFSIKDVSLSHIYYVQSIHKANDEKPEIFIREFVVMEGMSLVIDTPILNAADADIPGTVPVVKFSLEQIKEASNIVYEHDDSETKEDSFEIRLTDGKHTVEEKVLIMVIPVDDETPRMAINDGLEVEIGETKVISNRVLKATDLDSEDKELTYIIRFGPSQGYIQRITKHGDVIGNISIGMNFTQDEIDKQLIQYVHTGQEGVRDLLKFDVTDGINPLIDRYFYINIGSIDMVFPDVINKGVTLKEGGKVTLTTDLLSTTDINSPDEFLSFSITRAPSRGHLESTDLPGVPISTFTQLQLAGNKIYYIHTSDDEVKMDSFEFEVTDGYNPVFRTFRVSITDVDNKKPVLTINKLLLGEGETKLITPFELTVEDRDTPDSLLRFVVTQVPVHGQLLFNGTQAITTFTKQDLNENLISYKHDGTETNEDSFSFTVTDGTHIDFYVFPDTVFETRKPQVMTILINTVDNGVPQIVVNKAAPTLRVLHTGHLGFLITSKALKAEDRDSPSKVLKYSVSEAPLHGFIINIALGNNSIKTFSQSDIDDMKICYVLLDGSNATSDIFYFTVEDNEKHAVM